MKQTPPHDHYNAAIFSLLPPGLRQVVEIGCMRGALARAYLANNPACQWIGIDIVEDNVEYAQSICHSALCRDVESLTEAEYAQWNNADAWIFGDALEHLRDPWRVLARIRAVIPADGSVLASIPNAQNWSLQARLNAGQFHYEDEGLLDRTHLRFFTRQTIFEMFQNAGFRIETATATVLPSPQAALYMPHIRAMAAVSGIDPDLAEADATAFQYIVRAVPV